MKALVHTLLAATAIGLCACTGTSGGDGSGGGSAKVDFDATALSNNIADNVITADYVALDAAAANLVTATTALRTGGATEAELDDAQLKWKATRVPWESSEGFLFGPVDAEGIDPLIDTWPLAITDLQNFLAAGNTSADSVRGASENVQGFHTLEYLLFGDGVADNDQSAADLSAQELDYLVSCATVLRERTQRLAAAWTTQSIPDDSTSGPYANQVKTPGPGRSYTNQAAVIEELVQGIIGILNEVGTGKIASPFGTSISTTDNSLEESQFSYNSLTDFHDNVGSALNIYTGVRGFDPRTQTPNSAQNGLFSFVFAHDAALSLRIYDEIRAAYDAIGLIDGDSDPTTTDISNPATQKTFRQAINDPAGRVRVQTAIDRLATAEASLTTSVLPLIEKTQFAR